MRTDPRPQGLNLQARRASLAQPERRRWLRHTAAAAAALALGPGLAGCSRHDIDHQGDDAPSAAPLPGPVRTAWVFSSGGPRCFVHVGVLKAMEELGLRPDLVVGASAGALVGVLWASGCPAQEIETLALGLNPLNLARVALGASERLSGSAVAALVQEHSKQPLLEQLTLPAVCVAHRRSGEAGVVGFNRGDAGLAVQAACAIEGQFAPLVIRGHTYVDADLHMPLPVRLARGLGAQRVLAVDASAHEDRAPPAAGRWREGDLRKRALTQPDAQAADVLLHPDFGYYVSFSREFRERCIAAGYRDTMAAAPALQRLHAA